jgi:hypothetical protein
MNDKRLKPVWGAEKIGGILGTSLRKTFYLLEKGVVPARKVGDPGSRPKASWRTSYSAARRLLSSTRWRDRCTHQNETRSPRPGGAGLRNCFARQLAVRKISPLSSSFEG